MLGVPLVRMIRIVLGLVLASILGACTVESDKALFASSDGQRPFPSQAFILAPDEIYALQGNGGGYDFRENDAYRNVTFVPLNRQGADTFYVAQVKKADGGYTYALIDVFKNGARRWPFAAKPIAERLGIAFSTQGQGIKVSSREDLLAIYRAAFTERSTDSAVVFKVFDAGDERQRAAGIAYLEQLSAEQSAKKGAPAPAQAPPPAVAEAGNWVYREEIDPLDDTRKQYLFGRPSQASGTQADPYIRIGCYDSGMGITLFWGNVMADAYPGGDSDFVNVSVRFDTGDVHQLGWAPSEDWTATYPPGEINGALTQLGNGLLSGLLPGLVEAINTTWDAKQFHFSLLASDQVVLRAPSRTGAGSVTLTFDLAGYAQVAQNFRASCL
jgi:hypothetical protein